MQVQNRYGTLHGGCIATIVDTVGTAALVTMSPISGVSLSISVDYLSPQPGLEECEVTAQVQCRLDASSYLRSQSILKSAGNWVNLNEGFTCFWNWQVVKAGRTIATIAVELRQKRTGKLVAVGKHIKFLSEGKEPLVNGAQSETQSRL